MAEETLFHWPSPNPWRRELSGGDDKVHVVNWKKRGSRSYTGVYSAVEKAAILAVLRCNFLRSED